jgi:hypothetical protein
VLLTAERVLFDGLVDYAGLFPPAQLAMDAAVAEYRGARRGPHAWILGRFICPASRLEELAESLTRTMRHEDAPWALSVVLDGNPAEGATLARAFEAEMSPAAIVDIVEARLPPQASDGRPSSSAAAELRGTVSAALSVSPTVRPYLEVAVGDAWRDGIGNALAALSVAGAAELRTIGAKIRCGGAHQSDFPTSAQLAAFLVGCARNDLPFKATAGLHHPIRHVDEALGAMRHGFVNLLFAAALASEGEDEVAVAAILSETENSAFSVVASRLSWRGRAVGLPALKRLRAEGFVAFGSCNFDEPVEDLLDLRMIAR